MIKGIPRLSVLIITYKQEELIRRAINSLLAQKDYIYEICVSDDCSPDGTWDVLNQYKETYPDLIKLNRNDPNLGIFANFEKVWTMATGDVVYTLAGDDECPDGWFKTVVDYILKNQIDYKNDYFAIYGDYEARYPNGDSFVFSNSAIKTGIDPVRLSIRGIIGNRSAVCSHRVVESYKVVSKGKSHIAESAQDRQLPFFSKKIYYIPQIGNIYYTRIGVSAKIDDETRKEREEIEEYALNFLVENGYKPQKCDYNYVKLQTERSRNYRLTSFRRTLRILRLRLASFDPRLFFMSFRVKRYIFALCTRLPHKKQIKMTV